MYNWPVRKPQRWKLYDYSSEWSYFLTFCVYNREKHLGEIYDGQMILNHYGQIAYDEIIKTHEMRQDTMMIDEFVIMPNHIHMIVHIVGNDRVVPKNDVVPNEWTNGNNAIVPYENRHNELIPKMMKWLKSSITKQINDIQTNFIFSWQKSYHDHIIRDENELIKIQQYIMDNPKNWHEDRLFA